MAEPFLGQISVFGFNFAPVNWALCNGQIIPISQNTQLFSLIGSNFGGDGRTRFALPNMQGNVAMGLGTNPGGSSYVIGQTGGQTDIALSRPQGPPHTHNLMGTALAATSNAPAGNLLAKPEIAANPKPVRGELYNTNALDTPLSATVSPIGNGQPHDNVQPFLGLNYCICIVGIFPQRG